MSASPIVLSTRTRLAGMCRFTPRIRPRRRDTTSTLAPAVFRARSGTISSTFSKPSAARAAIVRPLSRRLVAMSSPCRHPLVARWRGDDGTPPDSGSLEQGAEELFIPGWLLSGEPDTHTRQPDTSLGELKLDQSVVWLVRPNPPLATMGTSSVTRLPPGPRGRRAGVGGLRTWGGGCRRSPDRRWRRRRASGPHRASGRGGRRCPEPRGRRSG